MNEDCRKRGLSNKKILTVVAISTLLLSSGNVIATQTTIDGSLRVTEQLQTQIVNGLVIDVNGEPVIGASVVEKGTTNGGITDINGKFTLNVKPGSTLQISFVGYQTQEVKATKTVKVVLKEDSELLSEVVVVGYGTQKKANLTGAVATVDVNKTLDSRPIADIGRGLQGSVPGVNITIPTGEIGSDPLIKIRGQIGSISGNNTPLILLDNVEIPSIQMVNPNDVQSISVLKDAATAAIYGSRSAAGVILIETHRGTMNSAPKITFSGYWGLSAMPKRLEVCNSAEFIKVRKMALINAGTDESRWPKYISEYERDPSQFADTDWQKEYYQRGFTQKYNIGYTAGSANSNVSLSAFYSKTDGVTIATGDEKFGFRLNSDVTRGKFKMGESVSYVVGRPIWNPIRVSPPFIR